MLRKTRLGLVMGLHVALLLVANLIVNMRTASASDIETVRNTYYYFTLSPTKQTALANGIDPVIVHVKTDSYFCNFETQGTFDKDTRMCTPSGTEPSAGAHLDFGYVVVGQFAQEHTVRIGNNNPYVLFNSNGEADIALFSNVEQEQNVFMTIYGSEGPYAYSPPATITFSNQTQQQSSSGESSPKQSVNNRPTPTKSSESPATTVELHGIIYKNKDIEDLVNLTIEQGQSFTLHGRSVPNSIVTLYIHSDTQTLIFPTDPQGFWTLPVNGLKAGEHIIEASYQTAKDAPSSDKIKLLDFKVDAARGITSTSAAQNDDDNKKWISLFLITAFGIVLAVSCLLIPALRKGLFALFARVKTKKQRKGKRRRATGPVR